MPPFIALKEVDSSYTVVVCSTNKEHGLASKFCKHCKVVLCLNCAFDHITHGDLYELHSLKQEWNKMIDEALPKMQLQKEYSVQIKDRAKVLMNELNQVRIFKATKTFATEKH